MGKEEAAEVIGDSLIPVINKLQDIFSQVGPPGRGRDSPAALLLPAAPKAAAAGVLSGPSRGHPLRTHPLLSTTPLRLQTASSACVRCIHALTHCHWIVIKGI
jgi:hypothetical protein